MPSKIAILNNIIQALGQISIAGGYRTDVETVEHGIRNWREVKNHERPYIGVAALDWDYKNEINGVYDQDLIVVLGVHVDGDTGTERAVNLDAIEDDIIGALHLDVTRGGNAVRTRMKRGASDEADPTHRPHGTMQLNVLVEFQRRMTVTP